MRMPEMAGQHHRAPMRRHPMMAAFFLFHCVFYALAMVCFLGAINRAAGALKLNARIKALHEMPEAFTEEERIILVHKVTTRALGGF
jgi:hypothetical protein